VGGGGKEEVGQRICEMLLPNIVPSSSKVGYHSCDWWAVRAHISDPKNNYKKGINWCRTE